MLLKPAKEGGPEGLIFDLLGKDLSSTDAAKTKGTKFGNYEKLDSEGFIEEKKIVW